MAALLGSPLVALALLVSAASAAAPLCSYNAMTFHFPKALFFESFTLPLSATSAPATLDFALQYGKSFKILRDLQESRNYVLYQCGSPRPLPPTAPKGAFYFQIPLSAYALASDVPVTFLRMLGVLGGMRLGSQYTVDACGQKLLQTRGLFQGSYAGPVITANPFGLIANNYITYTTFAVDPLHRAQWIKYISTFFNAETRAFNVYKVIQDGYLCLKYKGPAADPKPVVAWLSYYGGSWTLSNAPYKLKYVLHASAYNVPIVNTGSSAFYNMSKPGDVAAFKQMLKTVNVIIDETYLPNGPAKYNRAAFLANARLSAAEAAAMKFIQKPNVWSIYGRYNRGFATDWFEGALAQPQIVLRDLLKICHPSLFPTTPVYFFYNVARNEVPRLITAASCTVNPTAPLAPTPIVCPV